MSKVRSRSSWIGGGSQRRAPANTTSSARHISRANPNLRANHRRRILRRFMVAGYHALAVNGSVDRACRRSRPIMQQSGMDDEVARLEVGDTLQKDGVRSVDRDQGVSGIG